jgi:hypothetical protein
MSSPLAIATVTATLLDLLNDGLINNDLSAVGSYKVSAMPPDRVVTGAQEPNQINLFLYRVSPNSGWSNVGMPSHSAAGERLSNPPLALDLHYLLTAYGQQDLCADVLFGYSMELLHDTRVLARGAIRKALSPDNPVTLALNLTDAQGRKAIDLADQFEQIKIAPNYLSAEELSKLWTAMQARYRPSMAYTVSVVLIQGVRPTRDALPVLRRGSEDRGVLSAPDLAQPLPTLPTVLSLTSRDAAGHRKTASELGDTLQLDGYNLQGDTVTALFRHALLANPIERAIGAGATATRASVTLPDPAVEPAAATDWPAGNYTVGLRIQRAGKPDRFTETLPFALAPKLQPPLPLTVARAGDGSLSLSLDVLPQVWPEQRVYLLLGGDGVDAQPHAAKTGTLAFDVEHADATEAPMPLRVQVDGVDSVLVRDIDATPPTFDPSQSITIT